MRMSNILIEYPKCSTCRKARKWLEEQGVEFVTRHIAEQPPTAEELCAWRETSGLPLKKFFNTCGMKYRELGLSAKLADMSEEEQVALLASDGMLVKRPLLVKEGVCVIPGFKAETWQKALGK